MMNFEEARKFIEETSKTGSVLGLESIESLMEELGNIQDKLPIIHIAGTNGKGSVGAYLQSIFKEAGLSVARYCSPAVFHPLEVWQYCGENISENEYAKVMSQVKAACDIMVSKGRPMPTVFEVETAAAFVWFYEKKADIVLLEVGMGGQTDATNVIRKPLASVITSISRDHMGFLGDTVEEIAKVKAGIIKQGCPVFSTVQESTVEKLLREKAAMLQAEITFIDNSLSCISEQPGKLEFTYHNQNYKTTLAGIYQLKNAALAIEVALYLLPLVGKERMKECDSMEMILAGIEKAHWPGRFEVIGREPLFIIDGAHNEDAAKQLELSVQKCFKNQKLTYIIGVLADKEHEKMLKRMLPYADCVYTVTPNNIRALHAVQLFDEAKKYHDNVTACKSVKEAVIKACALQNPVLAFGSLSYLGELKDEYRKLQI